MSLCKSYHRLHQASKLISVSIYKSHNFSSCTPCDMPTIETTTMPSTTLSIMPSTRLIFTLTTIHYTSSTVMPNTTSSAMLTTTPAMMTATRPAITTATTPAMTLAKTPNSTPQPLLPHYRSSPAPCVDSSIKQYCSTHLHRYHQRSRYHSPNEDRLHEGRRLNITSTHDVIFYKTQRDIRLIMGSSIQTDLQDRPHAIVMKVHLQHAKATPDHRACEISLILYSLDLSEDIIWPLFQT